MPQNPNENQDQQSSSISNEKDTWTAPKGSGTDSFVKIDVDDVHPERIERLGQYLSSTTRGDMSNPDVRGGQSNHFPVSPPDEITPKHFQQGLESSISDATDLFNELSRGSSFEPGVATNPDWTYGSGHDLLGKTKAQEIVENHIDNYSSDANSRWFGIGVEKFPSDTSNYKDQVQRSGTNLNQEASIENPNSAGSNYLNYQHKTGQKNNETESPEKFWDSYFERLGYVGAKITLGAQGFANPDEAGKAIFARGSVTGLANATGNPSLDDLSGNYSKVSLENTEAGNTFLSKTEELNGFDNIKADFSNTSAPKYTAKSYGQMHSWNDPFESTGFPLVENRGLVVAGQLLEIWAMSVLKTFTTTALLQIGSYLTSVIMQNIQSDGSKGGVDYLAVNWNTNYYPDNPLVQPGTAFFKGYSGFNHPATNLGKRGVNALNRGLASIEGGAAKSFATTLVAQQIGPPLNSTSRSLDRLLNFTSNILRDLNIYMPRHIISQMAQEVGYHGDDQKPAELLKQVTKLVDIGTAYTRAMTIGMSTMAVHILADDNGKSLGFYRTLFREVVRSKAVWAEQRSSVNKWDGMLSYFGKNDKIMKFVNYLAMIGDMSVGAGEAGNIAFPENKVPLDQIGNHPSLRTVASRKRSPSSQGHKSRLSLTDTPSLFLLPTTPHITRAQLIESGFKAADANNFANISGANELYVGDDKAQDGIKNKFQKMPGGRFDPEQVQKIEDQLEAEHLPFYIQDLRTNEIISFHAFLTSLSDSYSADWSAQKGFGRIEAAQIYGGGSRSISVNFLVVPMNEDDFDEMYYKINKLTTLVYPQWSQGTMMQNGESTYVQPFSQVPTASPLCRIRVGDLFTSNYSDIAMARMMGVDSPNFNYIEPDGSGGSIKKEEPEPNLTPVQQMALERYADLWLIGQTAVKLGLNNKNKQKLIDSYNDDKEAYRVEWKDPTLTVIIPSNLLFLPGKKVAFPDMILDDALRHSKPVKAISPATAITSSSSTSGGIASLFDRQKNPIMKSFNSTMGRGIAVAITGIGLDWKLNSAPWNMEPGHKAPRMCEISLSLIPIHDITPGLDHEGVNRAPIYKVGKSSKSLTGDVWHNSTDYNKLVKGIESDRETYLRAEEKDK